MTRETVNIVENFLGLDSLSTRRKLFDIMLVYNILNNLNNRLELLSELGFRILCRNTRKLNLFIIHNYNTDNGNM